MQIGKQMKVQMIRQTQVQNHFQNGRLEHSETTFWTRKSTFSWQCIVELMDFTLHMHTVWVQLVIT